MISKELVAASTEPLILSLFSKGESYGYALIQEVRMLSGDRIEWTDGMLYPVLHRMEENGWIKSRWVEIENGRKRKYYALKKDGYHVLNGSISTDLQKGDQDRHFPCRGALGGTLRHWLRHFRAAAFRDRGSIFGRQ